MPNPYRKNKDTSRIPCVYFKRGSCANKHCPFLHVRGGEKVGHEPGKAPGDVGTNLLCTMLKLVFEKQQQRVYNAETGVLNLTQFKEIPDLTDVAGSINFNTQAFCQALCSTIKSLIVPPPSAIQLKGNGILSVSHLAMQLEKADLHLTLRAISLEANLIKSVESLQELKKFTNLREIVLRDNPIANRSDYRTTIKKLMPSLIGLDGESICVPPLSLPWPQFSPTGYSEAQKHVLQFIQCGLLNPLEGDGASGVAHGVDAVSDLYAANAVLTLSLSSPEVAVSTPMRTMNGAAGVPQQRNVIRDIVSLRLKQTESNHNLLHGVKSTVVALGRTKVCSQMEHWLYPKTFRVHHYLHSSASTVFLDNSYLTGPSPTAMKVPVTIVTLHGTMTWNNTGVPGDATTIGPMTIRRNFTRVLSVTQGDAGRWLITNDMVSLYLTPSGSSASSKSGNGVPETTQLSECRILIDPRSDRSRAEVLSRKKDVPVEVIMALCQHVGNDAELFTVLDDIRGVPLSAFEHCANLAGENIMESIQMCRLVNLFGMAPQNALEMLRHNNGNWSDTVAAVAATAPVAAVPQ